MFRRDGTERLNLEAYRRVREGDQVLVYQNAPRQAIVGKAHVKEGLHEEYASSHNGPVEGITFAWDRSLTGVEQGVDIRGLLITDGVDVKEDSPLDGRITHISAANLLSAEWIPEEMR